MTRHHLYKGASTEIRVMNSSSLTLSHVRPSLSTNILISSGMAREGWVSLSWMATYQVQHTHITLLDSIPTILDKSPRDSNALFIISRFAHKNSASFLKFQKTSGYTCPTLFVGCGERLGMCELKNASIEFPAPPPPIPWGGGREERRLNSERYKVVRWCHLLLQIW